MRLPPEKRTGVTPANGTTLGAGRAWDYPVFAGALRLGGGMRVARTLLVCLCALAGVAMLALATSGCAEPSSAAGPVRGAHGTTLCLGGALRWGAA